MPECEECGTIHGVVTRVVDGETRHFCVHHERGEEPTSPPPVDEYPDKR